ncbi:MAG: VOC family protein, partial [Chloroflexota bacterium]
MSDFYPMPSFVTLAVHDLPAAADWYERTLGFTALFTLPDPAGAPALIHLRRARYQDLLLVAGPPDLASAGEIGLGVMLTFAAGEGGVDALAGRAQ